MIKTDQFCPLKNSDSEQNGCVSTENRKVIETPYQQNQNLIQENDSKNIIIKILVENHTFENSNVKTRQLNHLATAVSAQHQYYSPIILFGINDLLNGSSIGQISKDGIEIARQCRNQSICKVFVFGIFH